MKKRASVKELQGFDLFSAGGCRARDRCNYPYFISVPSYQCLNFLKNLNIYKT